MSEPTLRRNRRLAVELAVAALAAVVYSGTLEGRFLTYDDPALVLRPAVVRHPSLATVVETLAHPIDGSYHPLHILSYAVDACVFGLERPAGFHATNVLLFACVAALSVRAARRFGVGERGAAIAGVIFAVHPCHVESVAWVSERKDVLSGVLVLLALLAAPEPGERRSHLPSLGLFLLALASKTSSVVLAPYLVLEALVARRLDRWTAVRLAPFVLLAGAWVVIELRAQQQFGFVKPLAHGTLASQLRLVAWALAWYPVQFAWPAPLTPRPLLDPSPALGAGDLEAAVVLLALLGVAVASLRREGVAARLVGWFLLALAPISNIVPMATHAQHRYLFLPSVAAAALAGALFARGRRHALVAAGLAALVFLATTTTVRYARAWRTDRELWTQAVSAEPENGLSHVGLGAVLATAGEYEAAAREAEVARATGAGLLGETLGARVAELRGRPGEARALLEEAWRQGGGASAGAGLVRIEIAQGDIAAASSTAATLAARSPGDPWTSLAAAWLAHARGDLALAAARYAEAAPGLPGTPEPWLGLAQVARARGDFETAAAALESAREAEALPFALLMEGAALALARGEPARADALLRDALRLSPDDPRAAHLLGLALAAEGRLDESATLLEALASRTRDPEIGYDLARALARAGRAALAREALESAVALRPALAERARRDPLLSGLVQR
jgi:tetratricopeptide (TPR) repeat protein